jgi:hypothetical protein
MQKYEKHKNFFLSNCPFDVALMTNDGKFKKILISYLNGKISRLIWEIENISNDDLENKLS